MIAFVSKSTRLFFLLIMTFSPVAVIYVNNNDFFPNVSFYVDINAYFPQCKLFILIKMTICPFLVIYIK